MRSSGYLMATSSKSQGRVKRQRRGAVEGRAHVEENGQAVALAIGIDGVAARITRVKGGVHRPHFETAQLQRLDAVAQFIEIVGLGGIAAGEADQLFGCTGHKVSRVFVGHPVAGVARLHAKDDDLVERLHVGQKGVEMDGQIEAESHARYLLRGRSPAACGARRPRRERECSAWSKLLRFRFTSSNVTSSTLSAGK